jgi:hypothetical protein
MNDSLLSLKETQNLSRIAAEAVAGDFVEVGVFKGASAETLCQHLKDRQLHLFDTWQGIVSVHPEDKKTRSNFGIGRYATDQDSVVKRLKPYHNVYFYPGEFPDTYTTQIKKVALLHIDVDLYAPTKAALELFWDAIPTDGKIIVHDYPTFEGVRIAVDNFLKDRTHKLQQLTKEQVLIIK